MVLLCGGLNNVVGVTLMEMDGLEVENEVIGISIIWDSNGSAGRSSKLYMGWVWFSIIGPVGSNNLTKRSVLGPA